MEELEEGWHWPVTFNDNGASRSNTITVWKVDATAVYLRIFIDANPDLNNYVKLTYAQNDTMIDDLLAAKCALTYEKDENVNMGSTTATVTVDGDRATSGNTQIENDFTYKFTTAFPAFIANYNSKQTTKTYDLDDVLTKTETFEYTIGTRTTVTLEATYNAGTIPGTIQYCIPSTTATVPFTLLCTQSAAAGPAGWAVPSADL